MAIEHVIAHIDAEIDKLQQARDLLSAGGATVASNAKVGKRGRPKGSVSVKKASAKAGIGR